MLATIIRYVELSASERGISADGDIPQRAVNLRFSLLTLSRFHPPLAGCFSTLTAVAALLLLPLALKRARARAWEKREIAATNLRAVRNAQLLWRRRRRGRQRRRRRYCRYEHRYGCYEEKLSRSRRRSLARRVIAISPLLTRPQGPTLARQIGTRDEEELSVRFAVDRVHEGWAVRGLAEAEAAAWLCTVAVEW